MIESLQLYFNAFKNYAHSEDERRVSYLELMGISWCFHLIYAGYSLFALFMGIKSYEYFSSNKDFTHLVFDSINLEFQKIHLMSTLFAVIFYPLLFQFGYKFWKALFKFYVQLFDNEDENFEEKADEILASAFSCNLLLVLPIVGKVLSNIAHGFFLYKGLIRLYRFTSLQAFLVLITPLFLIFLIAVFSASYFMFLFTLI